MLSRRRRDEEREKKKAEKHEDNPNNKKQALGMFVCTSSDVYVANIHSFHLAS